MTEPVHRRSRTLRDKRARPIAISDRDVEILTLLTRYLYLRSSLIEAFVGGNSTALRWRLRQLFDAGLVLRPAQQWQLVSARYAPAIYELSAAGMRTLQDLDVVSPDVTTRRPTRGDGHFWHTQLSCEIMASFEIAVARLPNCSLITEEEVLTRLATTGVEHLNARAIPVSGGRFVIPDGLFGIRSAAGVVLYALELDRGQEPLLRHRAGSTYKDKFTLYHELIAGGAYRNVLSTPAPLAVLHLTTTKARMLAMAKMAGTDNFHLFRCMSAIGSLDRCDTCDFIGEPWMRPDNSFFLLATGSARPATLVG